MSIVASLALFPLPCGSWLAATAVGLIGDPGENERVFEAEARAGYAYCLPRTKESRKVGSIFLIHCGWPEVFWKDDCVDPR